MICFKCGKRISKNNVCYIDTKKYCLQCFIRLKQNKGYSQMKESIFDMSTNYNRRMNNEK